MKRKIVYCLLVISFFSILGAIFLKINFTHNSYDNIYQTWQKKYIINEKNSAFVNSGNKHKKQTLSEAQGYGMVITMLAVKQHYANQIAYNGLVKFYLKHTLSNNKLMHWKLNQKDNDQWKAVDNSNATDGDLDIAYSLIMADKEWGSAGKYDYKKIAQQLLKSILEEDYNQKNNLLTVGNWANVNSKQFNLIRTSDLIPQYYKEFYRYTHVETWNIIYFKSIKVLQQLSNQSKAGLFPDFAWVNGKSINAPSGKVLENSTDGEYSWNACRIPLRLSLRKIRALEPVNNKLLTFFSKQREIKAGYLLNGQPSVNYTSMAFVAPISVEANLQKEKFPYLAKKLRKEVLKTKLSGNYYGDTLQTYSIMLLANQKGNDNE